MGREFRFTNRAVSLVLALGFAVCGFALIALSTSGGSNNVQPATLGATTQPKTTCKCTGKDDCTCGKDCACKACDKCACTGTDDCTCGKDCACVKCKK